MKVPLEGGGFQPIIFGKSSYSTGMATVGAIAQATSYQGIRLHLPLPLHS
ncbi:MAG TPA: hypothetical protein V6D30_15160 [Leptolyngbyaceae cyanobacterium]